MYLFIISRSGSYIKVIGLRLRSHKPGDKVSLSCLDSNVWVSWPTNFIIGSDTSSGYLGQGRVSRSRSHRQGHANITEYTHLWVICFWLTCNLDLLLNVECYPANVQLFQSLTSLTLLCYLYYLTCIALPVLICWLTNVALSNSFVEWNVTLAAHVQCI